VPSSFIAFEGARVGVTGEAGVRRTGRADAVGVRGYDVFRSRTGVRGVKGGDGPGCIWVVVSKARFRTDCLGVEGFRCRSRLMKRSEIEWWGSA
jgi:hypothetical protein